MATVGDNLRDSAARHTVYMERYATSTYRRQLNLIDRAIADISMQLAMRPTSDNTLTKKRAEKVLKEITGISSVLYKALDSGTDEAFRALAAHEATIQIGILDDAYPIAMNFTKVTPAQVYAASMSQPFQGKVLKQWWKDQEYTVRSAYQSAVRIGFVEGESIPQIVARVNGIGKQNKRQVEAVIRTAVNHMAQTARNKLTEANSGIFKEEEWSATLDGRTTAICRGRDGQRYPPGKGPYPPAHMGCRSGRIPVTKSWKELGFDNMDENEPLSNRPFVADKRKVKDIPVSERKEIIGSTTAASYNDWLKTQKRSFIDDTLGKQKAKLYLDGDLTLDRFTTRTGREYSLAELATRERQAFTKANVTIN